MLKPLLKVICGLLVSINGFSTANSVYHEFTTNTVGTSCGLFVNNLSPTNSDAVTIGFSIDYQFFTNQARIYYTTDGSTPSAAFGVPSGTTQVITASYFCTYNDGTGIVDVAKGTIPALPTGTVVKYIVSAWHSSGGLEIFASGGTNTTSATATVFTYTVTSALPIGMINFSAKKENETVKLDWSTAQEININRYEIYSSGNGVDFKNIGTKKAVGFSNTTTVYSFTDANPVNGKNFYKIKLIDNAGHFTYTNILYALFDKNTGTSINAAGKILHVRLNSSQKGNYVVVLINNSGQTLKIWKITDNKTTTEYNFDLPQNLNKSIYHIAVKGNATVYSQTIFIE